MTHPTTAYALDVTEGRILAGRLVRLACARHLRDLETGADRGLWFDEEEADFAFQFFEQGLRLQEGEHDGQPFLLEPAQQFIIGSVYGWKKADGYRRFQRLYIEMGKGNGKTPMLAGMGLKGLVADDEPGAEIYCAAVTRDQAGTMFSDAKHMAESSPGLAKRLRILEHNIAYTEGHSFMRPVSYEAGTLSSKRVHGALIDEIHEHPNAKVVSMMSAGTKGRRQPIIAEITNSGYDRTSVCWEHHEHSRKVLEGVIEDDRWFAYVCQLDVCDACREEGKDQPTDGCAGCDQWDNPDVWLKANPLLGVSITPEYIAGQVLEAKSIPSKMNEVKRLNFCIWTESASRWIDSALWATAPAVTRELAGLPCFAGLDLASTEDVTAFVLWFPDEEGGVDVVPTFWIPRDGLAGRIAKADGVPWGTWVAEGLINVTDGAVTDYDIIREHIVATGQAHGVIEVGYDGWQAAQLATQLTGDGFTMVKLAQSFGTFNEPMKEVERLLKQRLLRHGNNPVMNWMMANVTVDHGPGQTKKPSKDKSPEKIDGPVSMLMACARAIVTPVELPSVYEERGVLAF